MEKLILKSEYCEEWVASWTYYNGFLAESKEHLYSALVDRLKFLCDSRNKNKSRYSQWEQPYFFYNDKTLNVEHMLFHNEDQHWSYDEPIIHTLDEHFEDLD